MEGINSNVVVSPPSVLSYLMCFNQLEYGNTVPSCPYPTNKRQYIPGESIEISGQLSNSSDGSRMAGVVSLNIFLMTENYERTRNASGARQVYEIPTYATNGSYVDSGFSTQNTGTYIVTANTEAQTSKKRRDVSRNSGNRCHLYYTLCNDVFWTCLFLWINGGNNQVKDD